MSTRDILFRLIETVLENLKLQYKIETKTVPGMKRARKRKAWTKDEIAAVAGLNNILYFRLPGKTTLLICNGVMLFCNLAAGTTSKTI